MKRIISFMLLAIPLLLNACTNKTQASSIETVKEETSKGGDLNTMNSEKKQVLVAYFSATGTTKKVAEKIAELTNADLYEIVPKEPYSDADLNWHDKNSRTTKEMNSQSIRPEIASADLDLSRYKTIYLGYPIWWGDAPRIMSTFVEKYKFDGIKVVPFCTSGGSGIGRSGSNLAALAKTGNWANGERLNGVNSVQSFIDNNK